MEMYHLGIHIELLALERINFALATRQSYILDLTRCPLILK